MQFTSLAQFAEWIFARSCKALSEDEASFEPSSEACQWCPLRAPGLCAARDEWILSVFDLDDLDDEPAGISPERRGELLTTWAPRFREAGKWLADLQKQSWAAAMHGTPDPGTKLVLGDQGDRKWADAEAAGALLDTALGASGFVPRTPISPPQAEKLLKPGRKREGDPETWAALTALIVRDGASPILTTADDKKPEYRPVDYEFDEFSTDTEEI